MSMPDGEGESDLANVILSASQSPSRGINASSGPVKQPQVKVSQLVRLKPKTAMEMDFIEVSDTDNEVTDGRITDIPTEHGTISGVILQKDSHFDSINEADRDQEATERAGSLTRHTLKQYLPSTSLSLAGYGSPPPPRHGVMNPEWDSTTTPVASEINLASLLDSPLKSSRKHKREGRPFMMTGSPPRK